jgi:hypothetical protein
MVEDCQRLLTAPKEQVIESFTPEYAQLPASIRRFAPLYVEITGSDNKDGVPNVGLSKAGAREPFWGVRVFRSDDEARKYQATHRGKYRQLAPGTYFCEEQFEGSRD